MTRVFNSSLFLLTIFCTVLILSCGKELKNCFPEKKHIHYLFVNKFSEFRIPLLPFNCKLCQLAEQVNIELIEEKGSINQTIQRLRIWLKNFEVEDSTYICLIDRCPIVVQQGSDSILFKVTSTLLARAFLSLHYLQRESLTDLCHSQTRFSLFSQQTSLTCSKHIELHPKFNRTILTRIQFDDCYAGTFEKSIYRSSINVVHQNISTQYFRETMEIDQDLCQSIFTIEYYFDALTTDVSSLTFVKILPLFNPWNYSIITLGPCQTEIVSFKPMFFTDDVHQIRMIQMTIGTTIRVQCPIDGAKQYMKYTWFYQHYHPKYQISNNRTIVLQNFTETMQGSIEEFKDHISFIHFMNDVGKYICTADDGNEKLEFEMTLAMLERPKNPSRFNLTTILMSSIIISLICLTTSFLSYYMLKLYLQKFMRFHMRNSIGSSIENQMQKSRSMIIHHNVHLTIEKPTLDRLNFIDDPTGPDSPWLQLTSNPMPLPCRYSIRHLDLLGHYRNINGQPLSIGLPSIRENSSTFEVDQSSNQTEILKMSAPYLNCAPVSTNSSSSILSFDSEMEIDEFNRMSSLDNDR